MKKLAYIIVLVFALATMASAQYYGQSSQGQQGGLFGYGMVSDEVYYGSANAQLNDERDDDLLPGLPGHGLFTDQSATPVGSGTLLLIALGAAYALKRRKTEK